MFQFTQLIYQNTEGNNLVAAIELVSGILTFAINIQVSAQIITTGEPNAAGIHMTPPLNERVHIQKN